jgi:hypothetical protein
MQHTHRPRRFLAFPRGGTAPASLSLIAGLSLHAFGALSIHCRRYLILRCDRLVTTRRKTPLQGSRFADFSTIHRQSSASQQPPPRVISTIPPTAMANLFRRIYDWLLRLFWYAYLPSCHLPCAQALMPDAPTDTSISTISALGKSKAVSGDGPRLLLTVSTVQGDRDGYHHDRAAECWQDVAVESSGGESLPDTDMPMLGRA